MQLRSLYLRMVHSVDAAPSPRPISQRNIDLTLHQRRLVTRVNDSPTKGKDHAISIAVGYAATAVQKNPGSCWSLGLWVEAEMAGIVTSTHPLPKIISLHSEAYHARKHWGRLKIARSALRFLFSLGRRTVDPRMRKSSTICGRIWGLQALRWWELTLMWDER